MPEKTAEDYPNLNENSPASGLLPHRGKQRIGVMWRLRSYFIHAACDIVNCTG
jgi:hypothetical protein